MVSINIYIIIDVCCEDASFEFFLMQKLQVQLLVLVIEIFTKSSSGDIFDFVLKNLWNWVTLLFENVKEEHKFVFSLFSIIYLRI